MNAERNELLVNEMRAGKKHWRRILEFVTKTEQEVLPHAGIFADQPPCFAQAQSDLGSRENELVERVSIV